MQPPEIVFHPIISSLQKIALYETKARFFLVGSNNTQTRFRVLKIDRTEPRELVVVDDKVEYSQDEIRDLLNMIDLGNRTRMVPRTGTGLSRTVSAFGIVGSKKWEEVALEDVSLDNVSAAVQALLPYRRNYRHNWKLNSFPRRVPAFGVLGFVRFLEGYYIILLTKRRRIALVGHHTIYKIEDTRMIYIPNDGVRINHPDEPRYLRMFQRIDLSSNFYFSYSYDLTRTLQSNLTHPHFLSSCISVAAEGDCEESARDEQSCETEAADDFFSSNPPESSHSVEEQGSEHRSNCRGKPSQAKETRQYGIRTKPNEKFVWNKYLLSPVEADLHPDWVLYITHGFIGQSNISIFGRSVYLTVIARRSNKYAGTRFLKRGANFEGDVANEVETEQVVHDSGVSSLIKGHFTSFVQLRGSIPSHWSQDISGKIVAKPAISFDLSDPYVETAGEHFNQLLRRYGSPIIILNLVKKREKKKHESMLSEDFMTAVEYLNQFLPPEHQIQYISFDMARMNKTKEANVMARLGDIAHSVVSKTGIFHNQRPYFSHRPEVSVGKPAGEGQEGCIQTGVIRVNCVDCLDRTNTAQFALGKCALGFQLCALGILDSPKLEFDSDCVRMLEEMYEDHGDTLALQYGGSQLVHRITTYRKTAPWTSQGNDIMQTLNRYYSNTFSDAEKQHTMNLFLGLFVPEENKPPLWELLTDYYLHHSVAAGKPKRERSPKTQWWDLELLQSLPRAHDDINKQCRDVVKVKNGDEVIDSYVDYYKPYEFNIMNELFAYSVSHSIRDFMPHFTTNFSPFTVRVRPGKRREETSSRGGSVKNPSMTGQSSTSSTTSSASSLESEESDEEESSYNTDSQLTQSKESSNGTVTFESLFPSMRQVYGMEIEEPKRSDVLLYKRFTIIGRNAKKTSSSSGVTKPVKLIQQSAFSLDSSYKVTPPRVNKASQEIYRQYVERGKLGACEPSPTNLMKYQKYANNRVLVHDDWDFSV